MSEWGRLQDVIHDELDRQEVKGVDVNALIECIVNVADFFPGLFRVPVEPPATPGLREALDAHKFIHRTWLNDDEFGDMCSCDAWERPSGPGDSEQEWADHREAAVRAALSGPPATPEPPPDEDQHWDDGVGSFVGGAA